MGTQLNGRVALVTGGASGIGASCVERLACEGALVVLSDVQDTLGAALVEKLAWDGLEVRYLHQDVTLEGDWTEVISDIKRKEQRLDILVNNAGVAIECPSVVTMSLDDWRRQQSVNVDGVFLGIKHALPLMRKSGDGGSIVNMSSVAGLRGSATLAGYCATKGAVRLLTKAVALECAAAKDGVRVNSVHPGMIETPLLLGIIQANRPGADAAPVLDAITAATVPLGVKGLPEDVASGVLWLASDESRYVTGLELVIDGGAMLSG
jgi:NAD(P)-dependent dehydrogenase (short-subunit alcohol dehydrogenase family)